MNEENQGEVANLRKSEMTVQSDGVQPWSRQNSKYETVYMTFYIHVKSHVTQTVIKTM